VKACAGKLCTHASIEFRFRPDSHSCAAPRGTEHLGTPVPLPSSPLSSCAVFFAQAALDFVQRSDGVAKSRKLAEAHMQVAIDAARRLPGTDSQVSAALEQLCHDVLTRRA